MNTPSSVSSASEPAAPPSPEQAAAERVVCANCGARLFGPYCARCGQEARGRIPTLRAFAASITDNLLGLDTRVLRTMGPLFIPGRLARDYLAGKRVRYVPPLRLFLFTSFLLFLLLAAHEMDRTVRLGTGTSILQDMRILARQHSQALTAVVVALAPLFAFMLRIAYRRGEWHYLEHVVVTLYYHAFAFALASFLALIPLFDLSLSTGAKSNLAVGYLITCGVYLALTLRRVYGQRWLPTSLKSLLLGITYTIIIFLVAGVGVGIYAAASSGP